MMATWQFADIPVRMVECAPGYLADCERGRILLGVAGELHPASQGGRSFTLTPAMSHQVGEGGAPHRSHTVGSARLFIVERARLHHARRT
jgi:hypothetical protein